MNVVGSKLGFRSLKPSLRRGLKPVLGPRVRTPAETCHSTWMEYCLEQETVLVWT